MIVKDEMSLKDIVLVVKQWISFLYNQKILFIAISFCFGIAGFFYAKSVGLEYSAKTSFVLSTESKSGGILSAASQFGLDFGSGGGGGDIFSSDNIIMLFKSRLMLQKALMKKNDGTNETLLNYYIRKSKLYDIIKGNNRLSGCYPFPDNENSSLTPIQDSLIRIIHSIIVKENLSVERPDKKNSLIEVVVKSKDEFFSYNLVNSLVNQTIDFYVQTKTKVARENVNMLINTADSLRNILAQTVAGNADIVDKTFNLNPAYLKSRAVVTANQSRLPIITSALGEVEKSLVQARLSLQKETPLLQVIDKATLPLFVVQKSKKTYALYGVLLGFVCTLACLIIFKIFKDGLER